MPASFGTVCKQLEIYCNSRLLPDTHVKAVRAGWVRCAAHRAPPSPGRNKRHQQQQHHHRQHGATIAALGRQQAFGVFIPNQDISGNNCECDSRSERRGCWGQSEPGLATGRCAGAVSTVHEQAAQGLKGTVSDIRPSIHNLFSPTQGPSPSMMTMSPKPLAITARSSTACAATPSCSRTTSLRRWKTGRSRARKRCSVRAMLVALDGGGGEHSGCWRSGAAHHTRHAAK